MQKVFDVFHPRNIQLLQEVWNISDYVGRKNQKKLDIEHIGHFISFCFAPLCLYHIKLVLD